MFPSSAILGGTFPSDGDGNKIKGRYAISATVGVQTEKGKCCGIFWRSGFKWRKGNVEAFSGDRGSNGEKEMLRHFLEIGVQIEIGVEDYIQDEVLRIIFCSCVTLDSG